MPLHFCDYKPHSCTFICHINVSSYTKMRFYGENFEIVNVLNVIRSPGMKQIVHLIFVHSCLFIYKIQFLLSNMIRLSLQVLKRYHDDVILTSALRSDICLKLTVADLPSNKYAFSCKYRSFCIHFNIFIRLGIANSFIFVFS